MVGLSDEEMQRIGSEIFLCQGLRNRMLKPSSSCPSPRNGELCQVQVRAEYVVKKDGRCLVLASQWEQEFLQTVKFLFRLKVKANDMQ